MKKYLFLTLAAFITAGLLSYTTKKPTPKPLTPECYISCFTAETKEMIQADALKPGFAMLHENPLYYKLENETGKMVSFETTDGVAASGYLIASKKKSKKWLFVIQE